MARSWLGSDPDYGWDLVFLVRLADEHLYRAARLTDGLRSTSDLLTLLFIDSLTYLFFY